jgi:hypothetical protein
MLPWHAHGVDIKRKHPRGVISTTAMARQQNPYANSKTLEIVRQLEHPLRNLPTSPTPPPSGLSPTSTDHEGLDQQGTLPVPLLGLKSTI